MPAAKKAKSAEKPNFGKVFDGLKQILKRYEDRLRAVHDRPDYFYVESFEPTYKNRRMFFAAIRTGKNYVSFHLMPVYGCRELLQGLSPALKKRMQGKACFNFAAVDEDCFRELAALTEAAYRRFKELKYL